MENRLLNRHGTRDWRANVNIPYCFTAIPTLKCKPTQIHAQRHPERPSPFGSNIWKELCLLKFIQIVKFIGSLRGMTCALVRLVMVFYGGNC